MEQKRHTHLPYSLRIFRTILQKAIVLDISVFFLPYRSMTLYYMLGYVLLLFNACNVLICLQGHLVNTKIRPRLLLVGIMQARRLPLPTYCLDYGLNASLVATVSFFSSGSGPGSPPYLRQLIGCPCRTAEDAEDGAATHALAYVEKYDRCEVQDYSHAKKIKVEKQNAELKAEMRPLREKADKRKASMKEVSKECDAAICGVEIAR